MFQRELVKISISGFVGLVLGLIYGLNHSSWLFPIVGLFYAIGFFYGGKHLLLGGGKIFGAWFISLFHGGFAGFIGKTILMLVGIVALFVFGWVYGLVLAGKALYSAKSQDLLLGVVHHKQETNEGNRDAAPNEPGNDFGSWDNNNRALTHGHNNSDKDGFDF